MYKSKILALLLAVCMIMTCIGIFGIVANAEDITVINIGQGVKYLLPDGETYADTSKIGYRIIKGTDGVTYRVNVGEYVELMRDDFKSYTEDQYNGLINKQAIKGGTFYKEACDVPAAKTSSYLVKDGADTVLAIGPYNTDYGDVEWDPDNDTKDDAYKVSVKLKIVDFEPSTSSATTNYFFSIRPKNTNGLFFLAITHKTSREITATEVRWTSENSDNESVAEFVQWQQSGTKYSMKDYVELTFEGNNVQYSTYLNNKELSNSQKWTGSSVGKNGLDKIHIAKSYDVAATNAVTYIKELVYSKAVYVTDTLEKVPVKATLEQGSSSAQTLTVPLNMSNGEKRNFTVKYTADTSTLGEKTANGTIDGFDGTIPVTYTVAGVINDDFQNAELGVLTPDNPMNGWTVTNTKGTVDDTVITFKREEYANNHITSNNVLEINRTADDTENSKDYVLRRELDNPVTEADGDLISVKFNMMRNNNNTIEFNVGLESEYDGGTAVAPFKFILAASQIYLPGSDTPIYFDGKYDEYSPRVGIWHEFEILADIKNDYVYFYEQDKLLGSTKIENAYQKIYGLSAITLESVSTGNGSFNNGGGYIWIDDINVRMFSQQEALQEAGKRLGSMFRGRLSEDIALPAKGWYNTDIEWKSDDSNVIDNSGKITMPASGNVVKAKLTATVTANGVGTEKFYYTASVNPLSVLLDESFEFPRSVNGQPMSARPLTGGVVPWHGWIQFIEVPVDDELIWDTSGTIVNENENNKAFRLERPDSISGSSALYYWEKKLSEPVASDGLVSVSFRVLREEGSPVIRFGLTDDWLIEVRLGTGRIYHKTTWNDAPKFDESHYYATFGEWYNFDILIDFANGKCYAYCDNQFLGEVGDFPSIDGYKCETVYLSHSRANTGTINSKMLIDDIVVNRLSQAEFNEKKSSYEYASAYNTMIKDVSVSRGSVDVVTIRNFEASGANSVVLVAEYRNEDSMLQNVKMYKIPDESDVNAIQKVAVSQAAASGNKVKVFAWDKAAIKPLALESEILVP